MNPIILAAENGAWLPHDLLEVLWGSLAFFIVMALLTKFAKAPLAGFLSGRSAGIESTLTAAADVRREAEGERDRIKTALADSDAEAGRILADANDAAQRLREELDLRGDQEAAAVRERAQIELAASRGQVQSDLSGELSRLALGAAAEVVQSNLDESNQQRLIDEYIAQVGAQN